MVTPPIASRDDWQRARDELLLLEKEATRAQDAIAAKRRRLPMVPFEDGYSFDTPDGTKTLRDLFGPHTQLVIYQHMDLGPDRFCPGCTWFTDNVPPTTPRLLAGNDAAWWTVSDMPLAQLAGRARERGWTIPIASTHGTTFSADTGADGGFLLSVFLRDGDHVYLTYTTTRRGVDRILFVNNIQDLLPFGRQEDWEDSPAGWPQRPTYG